MKLLIAVLLANFSVISMADSVDSKTAFCFRKNHPTQTLKLTYKVTNRIMELDVVANNTAGITTANGLIAKSEELTSGLFNVEFSSYKLAVFYNEGPDTITAARLRGGQIPAGGYQQYYCN